MLVVGTTTISHRAAPVFRTPLGRSWAPHWSLTGPGVGGARCNWSKNRPHVLLRIVGRGAAFLGAKPIPLSFCSLLRELVNRSPYQYRLIMGCLSVCPRTSLLSWAARTARRCEPRRLIVLLGKGRSCAVSFCWLVVERLVVRRRRASCRALGMGSQCRGPTSWGRLLLASSYSPKLRDPVSLYAPQVEERTHTTTS